MKDVWPYLTAGVLLTILLAFLAPLWAALTAAALTIAVASFFRDPRRVIQPDPRHLLSPADGKVVGIVPDPEGRPGWRRVSIFLSVLNVHVNRSPADARVAAVKYTPGSFLPAFREKASEANEQNLITLDTDRGALAVKQIAGLIARRIRCWKKPGDRVAQGEKIGFITFGSRVDLYVPQDADIKVSLGQSVRGGTTVVAVYPDAGRRP